MSSSFDPYHQWLGIRDPQRPPNLYRLLGIDLFESDTDVIETAADRQMAHLRTFQNGPHGEISQRLLNEVAAAKVCLLNGAKKSAYDAQLRVQQPPTQPPVAAGQLVDQDDMNVVVKPDSVTLRVPDRGPRAERPWYVSMMFLLPLLAVVLSLVAYRIYRDHFYASGSAALAPATDAAAATALERELPAPDEAEREFAEDVAEDTADPPLTSRVDIGPAQAVASESTTQATPAGEAATEAISPAADAGTPGDSGAVSQAPSESDAPPEWNAAALAVTGQPAQFNTSLPMGTFLLALSQRDVAAAESALQALRINKVLGMPESQLREAELVLDSMAQFWQAVDAGLAALQPQDPLTLGQLAVTVVERGDASLKLEAPTGQQHAFEVRRSSMHRDLAVALVERHFVSSPATGWRLIAIFLAIDREGDVARAEYFAQQAELRGFAAGFLTQIVRHLAGDDPSDVPPLSYPFPSRPSTDPEEVAAAVDESADDLPDTAAQQQAKREVLSPILVELRQQEVPADQWPKELLKRADSSELDEAARYVLLDNALRRARSRRDMDTSLAIIDVLARDFGQNRADLRYDLLQTITRRVKGEDRRRYAEFATDMARDAVEIDDYEQAIRFASLAQSIGRSVPDRFFRKQLLDVRLEMDAIQKAFQALPPNQAGTDDAVAAAQRARFRVLAQGDFDQGLNALQNVQDASLQQLAQQELARPTSAAQKLDLARGWMQLAGTLSTVEKVNALRRARHWYEVCQPELSRTQRVEVQRDLDAIVAVLGRESEQLDLTELAPLDVSVGYGTFGINKNIDAASNPRVEPVPEVDGEKVSRFLWACAPSRIEYLLPEGAVQFQALGLVNAASSDGVRFLVKADGRNVFVSPPVKAMGGRMPIQVKLPAGTQSLELIVDAIQNNSLDHAYWIHPQIAF